MGNKWVWQQVPVWVDFFSYCITNDFTIWRCYIISNTFWKMSQMFYNGMMKQALSSLETNYDSVFFGSSAQSTEWHTFDQNIAGWTLKVLRCMLHIVERRRVKHGTELTQRCFVVQKLQTLHNISFVTYTDPCLYHCQCCLQPDFKLTNLMHKRRNSLQKVCRCFLNVNTRVCMYWCVHRFSVSRSRLGRFARVCVCVYWCVHRFSVLRSRLGRFARWTQSKSKLGGGGPAWKTQNTNFRLIVRPPARRTAIGWYATVASLDMLRAQLILTRWNLVNVST